MRRVILFDFDDSLIDCNSDPWVAHQLGETQLMNSLINSYSTGVLSWTEIMDRIMGEVHSKGKTMSNIENALKAITISPEMIRAIQTSFFKGCDLQIISNGNSFFIMTILENYDLKKYFSNIYTNPAKVDDDGRLRIFPFHSDPHGCENENCPSDMCKGQIVNDIQKQYQDSKRQFIYIGDGKGDFCPTLKLGKEDHALARKDYPLWKLLCEHAHDVSPQVHSWTNAKDVEIYLSHLLSH